MQGIDKLIRLPSKKFCYKQEKTTAGCISREAFHFPIKKYVRLWNAAYHTHSEQASKMALWIQVIYFGSTPLNIRRAGQEGGRMRIMTLKLNQKEQSKYAKATDQ